MLVGAFRRIDECILWLPGKRLRETGDSPVSSACGELPWYSPRFLDVAILVPHEVQRVGVLWAPRSRMKEGE
jgi:hypothetical protein